MDKGLKNILKMCDYASSVPLFILALITTMDVIARYLLRTSVPDTSEISSLSLGIMISLAFAHATYKGEQVKFELILEKLPARARKIADIVALFITASVFIMITWQAINRAVYSWRGGEFTGRMEIPVWPTKLVFAFGCLLTALALIRNFLDAIRQLRTYES